LFCTDSINIQGTYFSDSTRFIKFLKDAKTIINNPTKDLSFDFGDRDFCRIHTGLTKGSIYMYLSDFTDEKRDMLIEIEASEIDSMERCFKRYLKESRN